MCQRQRVVPSESVVQFVPLLPLVVPRESVLHELPRLSRVVPRESVLHELPRLSLVVPSESVDQVLPRLSLVVPSESVVNVWPLLHRVAPNESVLHETCATAAPANNQINAAKNIALMLISFSFVDKRTNLFWHITFESGTLRGFIAQRPLERWVGRHVASGTMRHGHGSCICCRTR